MKQLLIQSRAVSDPIVNPLVGWWLEYYVFYVKHRDLDDRDLLVKMMLEPQTDLSSLNSTAYAPTNHYAGSPDWVQKCLARCVECYFRDEDEVWSTPTDPPGMPMAHALSANDNWADTLVVDASMPDYDPNDTSMQALGPQHANWEYLTAMKLTDMTYEQWLATYGVHTDQPDEAHKPELVRYLREWSYPTNTVEPTTGAPSSALSYSIAERADKDRFFREPGWLFGLTLARPKVYLGLQSGCASSMMMDAMTWLPAIMRDEPWTSLKQFTTGTGPAGLITDVGGYWVDIRDLLLYGDQFMYIPGAPVGGGSTVALPTVAGAKRYATPADVTNLFKSPTAFYMKQDGVVSLAILGAQQETT